MNKNMNSITIRKANPEDLPEIMNTYAYARSFMAEHGNPNQWGPTNWPPENLIREDICAGKSYVVTKNNEITGVFFYDQGDHIEPTYDQIEDGAWISDSPYGVIHRIAGNGKAKGIGHAAIQWAWKKCPHLRIDTHPDNTVMQKMLVREGFVHRGTIYVREDNNPRMAFERI